MSREESEFEIPLACAAAAHGNGKTVEIWEMSALSPSLSFPNPLVCCEIPPIHAEAEEETVSCFLPSVSSFFPRDLLLPCCEPPSSCGCVYGAGKEKGEGAAEDRFLSHTHKLVVGKKRRGETLFRLLDCKLLPQRLRKKEGGGGGGRAACGKTLACEEGGGDGDWGCGYKAR